MKTMMSAKQNALVNPMMMSRISVHRTMFAT